MKLIKHQISAIVETAVREKDMRVSGAPAYTQLVETYQDLLFRYVYSLCFDYSAAMDIVQETFIDSYAHLGSLKDPGSFRGWLWKIAYRNMIRYKKTTAPCVDLDDSPVPIPSHYDTPEQAVEKSESRTEIREACGKLSPGNRSVVLLYYLNGNSIKEISQILDLSENTVKKRLERSRRMLKKEMTVMIKDTLRGELPSETGHVLQSVNMAVCYDKAARLGELSMIEAMLMDGIDVNEPDIKGHTLLHLAAGNGNTAAAELLLRWGADPEKKDKSGNTSVQIAETGGFFVLAEILTNHSASSGEV